MTRTRTFLTTLLLAGGSTLALAGCKLDNRPLLARGAPPMSQDAYAAAPNYDQALAGLPMAPPAPVAYVQPEQAYYYPERAYSFERTAYRQAPDYGFRYGDVEPWAWAADDGLMFAEPVDDSYRYYYYEPGDAYPYYVRDDQYGYAYGDDGVLLALFNAAGALLAPDTYGQYAPTAGRYWRHAYDLNRSYYDTSRYPVQTVTWQERAPAFYADQQRWFSVAEQQPTWRAYRERHDNGLHLGWAKAKPRPVDYAPAYRDGGWNAPDRIGPREARAAHGPPDHGWKAAREDDHGRDKGAERRAREVQEFARQASARAPDPAWRGPPSGGEARGHGKGHGGDGMRMAQAAPQPQHGGGPERGPRGGQGRGQDHGPQGGGGPDRGDHGAGQGHGGGDKDHGGGHGGGGGHGKGK